ncbi:MAG: short chain dehydrogenase [Acidiferrobacterales bacterium]
MINKVRTRKVLVVGASGLLGSAVVRALDGRAEVILASLEGSPQVVDITDRASIEALFERVGIVDAIVCTAGMVRSVPWANVTDDDWAHGLSQKLMGQVNLVRIGAPFVRDGGGIILTSGMLAQYPMLGSSIVTTVNAAVEGFVRSAAIEIGRGVRVNAVSPGWVAETMAAMGMDPSPGLAAADVAERFVQLIESDINGSVIIAAKGG